MRCEFPTVCFESETAMMRCSDYVKAGRDWSDSGARTGGFCSRCCSFSRYEGVGFFDVAVDMALRSEVDRGRR